MRRQASVEVRKFAGAIACALAVAGVLFCLFLLDPAQHRFYPACYFHQFTGLQCPGCGSLRALHEALHGHFSAAFRLNPLLILTLPLMLFWAVWFAIGKLRGRPPLAVRPIWLWLFVGAMIAFGVLRNVPLPFLHAS